MDDTAAAINLIKVCKSFGSTVAVRNIDLTVAGGEMVGLVGPDGAGKTTLARLAAGVLAPSAGRVEPQKHGRVGYLSGRFSLYPDLTVAENLRFFAQVHGMTAPEIRAASEQLLNWVGLLPFQQRLAGALSGGMRQKLALVCAVIHQPPVLILDEPTTAVDPIARSEFWTLLREQARQGRAVLVTTPYLDEAAYCDRVGLLHQGQLLALDSSADIISRLPYKMALLTGAGDNCKRMELTMAAKTLAGLVWTQPMGTGVRVALEKDAPVIAPDSFMLTEVGPVLEDAYLWLSNYAAEVLNNERH